MRNKLKLDASSSKEILVVFKCPFCLLVYAEGNLLIKHLESHEEKLESAVEAKQPKSKSIRPCYIRLNRCDHLISKWKGNTEKRSVPAGAAPKASKSTDNRAPSKPRASYYIKIKSKDGKTLFGCSRPECSKVYSRLSGCSLHYKTHLGIRQKCKYCNSEFAQISSLNYHTRKFHGTKA